MNRITEIKLTKKGRYALFCDGEYILSVDQEVLIKNKISVGTVVESSDIERIKKDSHDSKAVNKALRLVGIRSHSKQELLRKLLTEYDNETAKKAVETIDSFGYLNDDDFLEKCIESIFNQKLFSNSFAKKYLLEKGVDVSDYNEKLEMFFERQPERLMALIDKKRYNEIRDKKERDKAKRFLYNKGFPMGLINEALPQCFDEQDDEEFYE